MKNDRTEAVAKSHDDCEPNDENLGEIVISQNFEKDIKVQDIIMENRSWIIEQKLMNSIKNLFY